MITYSCPESLINSTKNPPPADLQMMSLYLMILKSENMFRIVSSMYYVPRAGNEQSHLRAAFHPKLKFSSHTYCICHAFCLNYREMVIGNQ